MMGTHSMPGSPHRRSYRTDSRAPGFTMVEILIVVVILGILAALVVPRLGSAADEARTGSIKMTVHRMREQINLYEQQHGARPTLADFADQMTLSSNAAGATAAVGTSGYPLGPYIREMPNNPATDTSDVSAGAVGTSAWYYDETTGAFHANDSAQSRAY